MFKLQHDKKQGTAIVHLRTQAEASYHKHGKEILVIKKWGEFLNSCENTSFKRRPVTHKGRYAVQVKKITVRHSDNFWTF